MKVGLIDADLMWTDRANGRRYGSKSDVFPNLAIMKISAWHKKNGDDVEWYNGIEHYDKVYVSKVFSSTPIINDVIQADKVIYGGSGFCIELNENGKEQWKEPGGGQFLQGTYSKALEYDVEHIMPDYSLYPMLKNTAIGYLTRGCPRGCFFCHVKAKEGTKVVKVADLSEWWNGQKQIVLCDPNILACKDWKDLFEQLANSGAYVDINQGLDARLITKEKVDYLNKIKLSNIHFAWDDYKQKEIVLKGLKCFADNFKKKLGHQVGVYVLTNFDTTREQDLERIYTLRNMGFEPYIMVYDKNHADKFYKHLQRWVNARAIFHKIKTFEEYKSNISKR